MSLLLNMGAVVVITLSNNNGTLLELDFFFSLFPLLYDSD